MSTTLYLTGIRPFERRSIVLDEHSFVERYYFRGSVEGTHSPFRRIIGYVGRNEDGDVVPMTFRITPEIDFYPIEISSKGTAEVYEERISRIE